MSKVGTYLVLDLETEGLNPKTDRILEAGAIAITDKLEDIAEFGEVCYGRQRELLSEFIQGMHGKSGLLDEIEERLRTGNCWSERILDERLSQWILQQGYEPGKVVLAGNSVHFDHAFIKERMPLTAALLSYRVKDIGALRRELNEIAATYGKPDFFDFQQPDMPHRGLADARLELEDWRDQRVCLFSLMANAAI